MPLPEYATVTVSAPSVRAAMAPAVRNWFSVSGVNPQDMFGPSMP
jgi:hypothetical protein